MLINLKNAPEILFSAFVFLLRTVLFLKVTTVHNDQMAWGILIE